MTKIYVVYHEGSYGSSGFVEAVGLDKQKLLDKVGSNHWDEIQIYDSETMELIDSCTIGHKYTYKNWDCRCIECKVKPSNNMGNK